MFGNAAALLNGVPYFGGAGSGGATSSGALVYHTYPGCVSDCQNGGYCPAEVMPIMACGEGSITWTPGMNFTLVPSPGSNLYLGLDNIYLNGIASY